MGPEEGVLKSPEEVEVKAHQNEEDLNQGGVIQARVAGEAADAGKSVQNPASRFESIRQVSSKYVSPSMHYTPFTISSYMRRSADHLLFCHWIMESGAFEQMVGDSS